ncbi:MAG: carbohydrate ABC transporter permease [Firmicutes bacterium]|nr:carbohydrate ABC transporter permease [Bacillota bacterium]MBQ3177800.1 carbohydrate ABC transporter permease [Clostridia bacterium]MBQ4504746.1 carbohydrate ABC transporter permease [Bacillota bacterium]MBR4073857.1 carbohydrate ABC transporter permease [Bacillota bacterium]
MAKKLRTRKHEVVLNRSVGGDAGITVILAIFGLFMFLPMYYTIIQSLKPMDELFYFPPRFYVANPTLDNFKSLFNLMADSWVPFSRYIFNTVLISVGGTFGNLVLSSLSAYALAKIDFPGSKFLFQVIQKSLMINAVVTGLVNFITLSYIGWIDTYLALIIPAWGSTLGLYLMKQFMETNVTTEVLESARLDGASELRTFWSIAMPMVKPAWLTLIIYSFQGLWNMGQTNLIYSEQLKTLNYAISQINAGGIARSGSSAAATVVMMMVPILVFVVSQSNIIETMGSSGMKD